MPAGDAPSVATCTRCGAFVGEGAVKHVLGRAYCTTCGARDDVDYLGALRARLWGKRDGLAWWALFGAGVDLAGLPDTLERFSGVWLAFSLVCFPVELGLFLRQRWARWAWLPTRLGPVAAQTFGLPAAERMGWGFYAAGVGLLMLEMALLLGPRNRLFFRMPVSERELEGVWQRLVNNRPARLSVYLGLVGLLLPPLGFVALVLAIVGLRRVDHSARPPIGRAGWAGVGLALGALGALMNAAAIAAIVAIQLGWLPKA